MLRLVRKYLQLDRGRQRILVQAWLRLGAARIALWRSSFKELISDMTLRHVSFEPPALSADAMVRAERVGWAVRTAAAHTPWKSTCLIQVLAAQRMLQDRMLPGAFYIGAAPVAGDAGSGLDAHAWLKCGDRFITGQPGHQRYRVVSAISWR